jgi:hypothetical protein
MSIINKQQAANQGELPENHGDDGDTPAAVIQLHSTSTSCSSSSSPAISA